jgi:hypothetical protein
MRVYCMAEPEYGGPVKKRVFLAVIGGMRVTDGEISEFVVLEEKEQDHPQGLDMFALV